MTTGPQGLRGVPPGGVQYAFLWVIVEVGVVHVTDAAANIVGVIACGKQCGDSARESGSAGRKGGDIWREGGSTTPRMRTYAQQDLLNPQRANGIAEPIQGRVLQSLAHAERNIVPLRFTGPWLRTCK